MTAISATSARKNLYQLISDVNANSMAVTITNSKGKNAVLLSEDDWNAIQETLYLNSIPGMAESIIEAKNEPIEDSAVYEEDEEW
ncbi:MAG: type II toxin-antitoxin system Phd/YefM family antitoxin [Clostridia bacterium]|nr:type II toxin-antitoxin system Phd/YefM family antitoxin [Clostridia bacterium]